MEPLVSVIMPVRNGGPYLEAAVESILRQTLINFELILVDDSSDDGAIQKLPAKDPRLMLLANSGRGVSSAFNTGLASARGAFIARMDADDIALPDRLEQQVQYLQERPGIDICGACVEIFTDGDLGGGNRRYQDWLNSCRTPELIHREIFIESPIPNPTALFRRAVLDALGGYHDPPWPEDYDLYLRADAAGMKMAKPDRILLRWREHGQSLTRTDERYALSRFQAAKAHYLAGERLSGMGTVVIWGAGPSGRQMHDLLAQEGISVKGFLEVHPRRTWRMLSFWRPWGRPAQGRKSGPSCRSTKDAKEWITCSLPEAMAGTALRH
jgi:cellulose synthase/poly-beta-1,6-N-acetylglucosamine synthase-like glycosyltransferase